MGQKNPETQIILPRFFSLLSFSLSGLHSQKGRVAGSGTIPTSQLPQKNPVLLFPMGQNNFFQAPDWISLTPNGLHLALPGLSHRSTWDPHVKSALVRTPGWRVWLGHMDDSGQQTGILVFGRKDFVTTFSLPALWSSVIRHIYICDCMSSWWIDYFTLLWNFPCLEILSSDPLCLKSL